MTPGNMPLPPAAADIFEIYELLMRLGLTSNYAGFRQSACAVSLAVESPDKLTLVSKLLYPEVAKRHKTTWRAVERNIRTAAQIAWKNNRAFLCELAGCELSVKPKPAQFIGILAMRLMLPPGDNAGTQSAAPPPCPDP